MIQPITTEEAQDVIRQWPARRADIDYSLHTSECSQECYDNDHALPGGPIAALLAIFFLLVGIGIGATALWLLRGLFT